ncbi:MAG: Autotransporter-associated beta strand repeat protein [Pedosphaera sp.]|nr:Autotransporter-associated beta strand repeat protein [Pedosphaera sp.]
MKPTNKLNPIILASLTGAAALLLASSSPAATFQWTNTASSSFVNAANWTNTATPFGNGVPTTGDTGINNIAGSTAVIGLGDVVSAATLDASAGTIAVTDGDLTASTMRATGSNGVISVSGGNVNLANLQITANFGVVSISGGTTTVSTDSRIGAGNAVWNVSNGTLNLSKHTIGSAAANNTNNVMTVSGNAIVTQNQGISGGVNRELWVGGNNAGSGTLILKDNATWTSSAANGNTDVIFGRTSGAGQTPVGTLTIQDNASFVVQAGSAAAKVIQLAGGPNDGATGIINLNGGNISAIGITRARSGTSTGTVNANGGKITALAAGTSFFRNFPGTGGANSINLLAGGLKFDTGGFNSGITNVLSGVGGLTKLGAEMLTLSGSNIYTGGTIVSNGTLAVTGVGLINASGSISVNAATLDVSAANAQHSSAGALTLNDATLIGKFSATNITVGTFGTSGTTNIINITELPTPVSLPAKITLINYTTAAPGLVGGGNVLTTLGAILPTIGNPVGYLTNNVANGSIDLVITSMVLSPVITKQPAPDSAYAGFNAHFSVELESTNAPGYQWRKGGVALSNGGHYSGVNTAVLKISNVSGADLANYDVVINNVSGSVTSSPAALTLAAPFGYEAAATSAGPAALFMFDEMSDATTSNALAFDYAGDLDGTYGYIVQNGFNGIAGPRPSDGLPGFDATNNAVRTFGFTPEAHVTIPALNLNTNTVTLSAWINPGAPAANAGLIFCRGGGTIAGLNFTANLDGNGYRTLGYTWNNEGGTFLWNSQIAPTPGQWSYVALVITPTNATVYIFDANGLRSSSQNYTHVNQSFSAAGLIGDDGFSGGNRQFDGAIDGVAIYAKSLTQSQLEALYAAGSGVSSFAPVIWAQPVSLNLYEQQNATFSVGASGTSPLSYQWQMTDGANFYNIANGGRISGATSSMLTISNLVLADATNLVVVVSNPAGGPVVSTMVTLTVNPAGPAEAITNSVVQTSGQSWETPSGWSDGLAASVSAASKPGSSYYVIGNAGLRTPAGAASATFPGSTLRVEGNGVFNTTIAGSGIGAVILKSSNGGVVNFPKLIMGGGEILNFVDSGGSTVIGGELNVISNTPIYAADDTSSRSIRVDAKLTGNGTVEYRAYSGTTFIPANVASLNIAGVNNTFTGKWNVLLGTLVGSAAGSLGTNTITVATNGAIQASYNIGNTNGALVLNGRFNLTRNHTFKTVTIAGTSLGVGAYTFAQLNSAYPANFPASWTGQPGALSETTASGSITVIGGATAPIPLTNSWNGTTLTLAWPAGWSLLEATNVIGPWTTNFSATSPFVVSPTGPQKFFRLQAQ